MNSFTSVQHISSGTSNEPRSVNDTTTAMLVNTPIILAEVSSFADDVVLAHMCLLMVNVSQVKQNVNVITIFNYFKGFSDNVHFLSKAFLAYF